MSEIFEFLVQTVSTAFNISIDALCTLLLAVSCIAPWRWVEILVEYGRKMHNWRDFCCYNLFLTLFDCASMPVAALSIISPQRSAGALSILSEFVVCNRSALLSREEMDHRVQSWSNFALMAYDMVAYCCLPIALLSPLGGQLEMVSCAWKAIAAREAYDHDRLRICQDVGFNETVVKFAFSAVKDMICAICLLGLLVPTTWAGFYGGILFILEFAREPSPTDSLYSFVNTKLKRRKMIRAHIAVTLVHGLLDMMMIPLWALALLSPYRHHEVRKLFTESQTRTASMIRSVTETGSIDFFYDIDARCQAASLGFLALCDIFMLPMVGALYVSRYRYKPVDDQLKQSQSFGLEEAGVVAKQFAFLCLDCLMFPTFGLVVLATRYRYLPVADHLQSGAWIVSKNLELYELLVQQFIFVLLDVAVLPLILFLLLTGLRAKDTWSTVTNPRLRVSGTILHQAVVMHIAIFLHDVLLLVPCVTVTAFIGFHRVLIIRSRLVQLEPTPAVPLSAPSSVTKNTTRQTGETSASGSPFESALPVVPVAQDALSASPPPLEPLHSVEDLDFPLAESRDLFWEEILNAAKDFPFIMMSLVVTATLWRRASMFHSISALRDERRRAGVNVLGALDFVQHCDRQIRYEVFIHFIGLLVDVLVLCGPFLMLLATLYRAPKLLLEMILKLRQTPLESDALFEVHAASAMWDDSSAPKITFELGAAVRSVSSPDAPLGTAAELTSRIETAMSGQATLVLISEGLWEQIERVLGGFVANLVRSLFPLRLKQQETFGFEGAAAVEEESVEGRKRVWVALSPLKGFPKRAMLRRLRRFNEATSVLLQLESKTRGGDGSAESMVVLFRWGLSVKDLIGALDTPAGETIGHFQIDSTSVFNVVSLRQASAPASSSAFASDVEASADLAAPAAGQRQSSWVTFVAEFHLMVLKEFVQLVLDLVCLLMFLFMAVIAPWRAAGCARWLVCNGVEDDNLFFIARTLDKVDVAEYHLLQFRDSMAVGLYRVGKAVLSSGSSESPVLSAFLQRSRSSVAQRLITTRPLGATIGNQTSQFDYHGYQRIIKSLKPNLSCIADKHKVFKTALADLLKMHAKVLHTWHVKSMAMPALHRVYIQGIDPRTGMWLSAFDQRRDRSDGAEAARVAADLEAKEFLGKHRIRSQIVAAIMQDHYQTQVRLMLKTKLGLQAHLQAATAARRDRREKGGFWQRSPEITRAIVWRYFRLSLQDYAAMLMLTTLMVTGFRLLAFVQDARVVMRELGQQDSTSPADPNKPRPRCMSPQQGLVLRGLIEKHLRLLARDLKHLMLFLFFFVLVLVTVIGIPTLLEKLPSRLHSIKEMYRCAREEFRSAGSKIFEMLTLLTVFRTYRVVFMSSLYCLLLPGACVAEIFTTWCKISTGIRLSLGLLVFYGLLGAVLVEIAFTSSMRTHSPEDHVRGVNHGLMGIVGGCVGLLVIAAASRTVREKSPKVWLTMSWNHILALASGPLECLQLSAVVLYFYWDAIPTSKSGGAHPHEDPQAASTLLRLGADGFSKVLLFWSAAEGSSGASSASYNTCMNVAAALVIAYVLLLSMPFALGGQKGEHRTAKYWEKRLTLVHSGAYQTVFTTISHLLPVWIILTLMRPFSCVLVLGDSMEWVAVLSTARSVQCDADAHLPGDSRTGWATNSSLALLVLFVVTSSLFVLVLPELSTTLPTEITTTSLPGSHRYEISEYGYRSPSDGETRQLSEWRSRVRFDAFYTLLARSMQLLVCGLCLSWVNVMPAYAVLAPILALAVLGGLLPWVLSLTRRRFIVAGSNQFSVSLFRSAGYWAFAWTVLVCLLRDAYSSASALRASGVWVHESTVAVGWAVVYACAISVAVWWEVKSRRANSRALSADPDVQRLRAVLGRVCHEIHAANEMLIDNQIDEQRWVQMIEQARDSAEFATLLRDLEAIVPAERLGDAFVEKRGLWVGKVESVCMGQLVDDASALASDGDEELALAIHLSQSEVEEGGGRREGSLVRAFDGLTPLPSTSLLGRPFRRLLLLSEELRGGLREPSFTKMSRKVLTVLLSYRSIPQDVAWVIFSYLYPSHRLRKALFPPERPEASPPDLLKVDAQQIVLDLSTASELFYSQRIHEIDNCD